MWTFRSHCTSISHRLDASEFWIQWNFRNKTVSWHLRNLSLTMTLQTQVMLVSQLSLACIWYGPWQQWPATMKSAVSITSQLLAACCAVFSSSVCKPTRALQCKWKASSLLAFYFHDFYHLWKLFNISSSAHYQFEYVTGNSMFRFVCSPPSGNLAGALPVQLT